MTHHNLILVLLFLASQTPIHSQVLISDSAGMPDSTAILEIRSSKQGLLPPRMTETERDAITNPTAGLMIYCTDCRELQLFNDTAWTNLIGLPTVSWQCNNPILYEGQMYSTVLIGGQCWMAENLNIGIKIDGATSQTNNGVVEKYCYSNDDADCAIYGGLYLWEEVMKYSTIESSQGICPIGWHVPSDDEYKTLEIQLGMMQTEADMTGLRGSDQGSRMASNASLWVDDNLDQNVNFGTSGFAALPSGLRFTTGSFFLKTFDSYFWSSSESGTEAWVRAIGSDSPQVSRAADYEAFGVSVRCLKD